jgi:SAM-dependent methyltransferase
VQKADYDDIADYFDRTRLLSDENMRVWLEMIRRASRAQPGAAALDIGCGTGRFSLPMAQELGFRTTGADSSEAMLAKARAKAPGGLVQWDLQDAGDLAYPDGAFDVVFMSHLLHHVDSPEHVVAECFRVLRAPGALLIRWGSLEQIDNDVAHRFFAEVREIDAARIPTLATLEGWLRDAGFADVASEEFVQRTFQTGAERLRSIEERGTSALTMITDEARERGLSKLRGYVAQHPDDPWLLTDRLTLTSGYRA